MPEIAFFVLLVGGRLRGLPCALPGRERSRAGQAARSPARSPSAWRWPPRCCSSSWSTRASPSTSTRASPASALRPTRRRRLLNWLAPFFNGHRSNATTPPGAMSGTRNWIGGAVFALALVGLALADEAARLVVPFFGARRRAPPRQGVRVAGADWVGRPPGRRAGRLPGVRVAVRRVRRSPWSRPAGVDGIRRGARSGAALARRRARRGRGGVAPRLRRTGRRSTASPAIRSSTSSASPSLHSSPSSSSCSPFAAPGRRLRRRRDGRSSSCASWRPNPFAERRDPYAPPAWVEALQGSWRIEPTSRVFGLDAMLYPNTAALRLLRRADARRALQRPLLPVPARGSSSPGCIDRFAGSDDRLERGRVGVPGQPDVRPARGAVHRLDAGRTGGTAFLSGLIEPGTMTEMLDVRTVSVGGEPRTAIFEHAPAAFPLVLPAPDQSGDLSFFTASMTSRSHPGRWRWRRSSRWSPSGGSGPARLCGQPLYGPGDPADPEPPGWRPAIHRHPGVRRPRRPLWLETDARASSAADWAGWTAIELRDASGQPASGTRA